MPRDYPQIAWDDALVDDCRQLIRLAVREDLGRFYDWTTVALVDADAVGRARVVSRSSGVVAGVAAIELITHEYDPGVGVVAQVADGQRVEKETVIAELRGPARSLLAAERPLLNLLGHLSGIATVTVAYVQAASVNKARIYDTRKTLPGYRRLEKYAVRCGGGFNHRLGLCDGVLIKDNHLALGAAGVTSREASVAAIRRAQAFIDALQTDRPNEQLLLEIEVESLDVLAAVLDERPDIVLLDNMGQDDLRRAVALRDDRAAGVELEASGGIRLENIAEIAATGVDRISVGALTHSAQWLDVGLDWD